MAKRKLTIYQRMNNIFGPDGVNVPKQQTNRYSIGKELLKTDNKADYEAAKLQAQQNKYLGAQWRKVDGELFQQSIHYETTRIGSYSDFENMEFYPEISAALDTLAEESTTVNEKGEVINIYSESKRVKKILRDLFHNRLEIHTSLAPLARNLCKYGDNFWYLNIDDKAGIIGSRQMPNFEMERREGTVYDAISRQHAIGNTDDDGKVKFYWRGRDIEFSSWQIAHFRLLGDDRRLPYGTSVLEKARRIWKQLLLSEDAMLIYRVTRAPERRVYKIYVGNIDDEDVPAYVDEIANRFKRMPVIDSHTGQIDLKYNQMANDQDFFIPVRSEDAPNPIDTLPGAQNLDQIADIEYLQRKLFTALRVPKSFLGYDEAVGEGKNLALQDIRFTRTINRIQQALLMELNKIAIIHLYLLGFEEELDNFTLSLNNPSVQADMLRTEHLQAKVTLYKDAVADAGNGFGAYSMTKAKKEILGWSEDEIKQDLLEQRMEKAAAAELENTANVIKNTGIFDKVDRIYGDINIAKEGGASADEKGEEGGPTGGGGGGFGGGGFGEEDLDFGDEGTEDLDSGVEGGDTGAVEGGDVEDTTDTGDDELKATEESIKNTEKLLIEQKALISGKKPKINHFNKLSESIKSDVKPNVVREKIYDKNIIINESVNNMIKDIDNMIDDIQDQVD
jgi:hypothetical protein